MEPGPTALVVDDDRSLRLLCRVNLELDGFSVREAATLAEASAALDEAVPSVVLLDAHLGRDSVDGRLERLRRDAVPVVVVTGSADLDDYRGRADEVLGKPFRPENLVALARRLARVDP
jgi:DNA-binding response OmpR family regulator